ncbi:MAG: hypothetical protein U0790_04195 [Isosphaeraceae bacterium]
MSELIQQPKRGVVVPVLIAEAGDHAGRRFLRILHRQHPEPED